MTRAVVTAFHLYTPDWGQEYYQPMLQFYLYTMNKYRNEYDRLYLIDSNWNIDLVNYYDKYVDGKLPPITVLKVNQSLRYYDAYKSVLPEIKEDLILFMDNDMLIYKEWVIGRAFSLLTGVYNLDNNGEYIPPVFDACGIYDSIGAHPSKELNGKTKFCPYFFCVNKDYLMKFRDCDWGPDKMPEFETLGELSYKMAQAGVRAYEFEEDKSNILFGGTKDGERGKDLGYYHIRSGSVPALLLSYREHRPDSYKDYIDHQPKTEYLRQIAWSWITTKILLNDILKNGPKEGSENYKLNKPLFTHLSSLQKIVDDLKIDYKEWSYYIWDMAEYHGLSL